MSEAQVRTVEQVRQVLEGTQELQFRAAEDDEGRCGWIDAVLRRLGYRQLRRAERGLVLAYLQRLRGYSRAQVTRAVAHRNQHECRPHRHAAASGRRGAGPTRPAGSGPACRQRSIDSLQTPVRPPRPLRHHDPNQTVEIPPAPLDAIEPLHIRRYLDWRVKEARKAAEVRNAARRSAGRPIPPIAAKLTLRFAEHPSLSKRLRR